MKDTSVSTFSYDENGNRTQQNADGEITSYGWDVENRLKLVTNPDSNTEGYAYYGDGYRYCRTRESETVYYLWDGENVLEESTHSSLLAHYTDFPGYWGGLISLSQPASTPSPESDRATFNAALFNKVRFNQAGSELDVDSSFYLFDSQANTRYLLNRDADVSDTDLYRAYGESMVDTGSTRNPHGFQGQVGSMTDSLDRVWMRARIYDTSTGTWLSRDPIGFAGGDWNLFRFVANNPANMMDPSGLSCTCCDWWILKQIDLIPTECCDSSCWETPATFPPRKKYQDPGIDPWYENARRRGGPPTRDWPQLPEQNILMCPVGEEVVLVNPYTGKKDYRPHARDMTPLFMPEGVDIMENIRISQEKRRTLNTFQKTIQWFPSQVGGGKPWDFKAHPKKGYDPKAWNRKYEDYGNFHFGVVGRAAGISRWSLLNGPGVVQLKSGTTNFAWYRGTLSSLDDPRDQEMDFPHYF